MNNKTVNIVFTVDTEGPLYESLTAKFERLKDLFDIDHIPPTKENFIKLCNKEIDLGGLEDQVAVTFSNHRSNYNDTWDKIDSMLEKITNLDFRNKLKDSFGGSWVYNWHCLDHVGFEYNPRRRDLGYHNIFDHYSEFLKNHFKYRDQIHWHFHPVSTYRDAHHCATSFLNSPELFQIISRKIIEREWFPRVFRAGFQTERPDSHWFLEQWIPFDISNTSATNTDELESMIDLKNGRSGDWRIAPADWSVYNPSHDNYQVPGNCRRYIGRALNVFNRFASIDQLEMDKAFERATNGLPTLLGIASHDFRNLEPEVDYVRGLIESATKKYPDVKFKFCEGVEGFRNTIWSDGEIELEFEFEILFHPKSPKDVPFIEVRTKKGKVFGPQPFLAIQTKSRRFIHDNFDFSVDGDSWFYAFHNDTIPIDDVSKIGVAANDKFGNQCLKLIEF